MTLTPISFAFKRQRSREASYQISSEKSRLPRTRKERGPCVLLQSYVMPPLFFERVAQLLAMCTVLRTLIHVSRQNEEVKAGPARPRVCRPTSPRTRPNIGLALTGLARILYITQLHLRERSTSRSRVPLSLSCETSNGVASQKFYLL